MVLHPRRLTSTVAEKFTPPFPRSDAGTSSGASPSDGSRGSPAPALSALKAPGYVVRSTIGS